MPAATSAATRRTFVATALFGYPGKSRTGKKEVPHAAIPEVEALHRLAQDAGMEVEQKGSDGVLVWLRDPSPQAMVPLYNRIPLLFCLFRAHMGQPMSQKLPDR